MTKYSWPHNGKTFPHSGPTPSLRSSTLQCPDIELGVFKSLDWEDWRKRSTNRPILHQRCHSFSEPHSTLIWNKISLWWGKIRVLVAFLHNDVWQMPKSYIFHPASRGPSLVINNSTYLKRFWEFFPALFKSHLRAVLQRQKTQIHYLSRKPLVKRQALS